MIFIDTGAFLARYIARDQYHARATKAWARIGNEAVTSNFVLNETFTLLGRWAGYAFAADRARAIMASDALTILRPADDDEHAALDLFEKYADQRVSFTDCLSFTLMQRHGIERAFTFDRHFRTAGFKPWPR